MKAVDHNPVEPRDSTHFVRNPIAVVRQPDDVLQPTDRRPNQCEKVAIRMHQMTDAATRRLALEHHDAVDSVYAYI